VASQIVFSGAGTLNAGGTFLSGTADTYAFDRHGEFQRRGAQSVTIAYTYNNFTVNKSGAHSLGCQRTIGAT